MPNLSKSDDIKSVADKEKLPLRTNQIDVTDDRSVSNAIQIVSEAGRIDVLVNNSGYGLSCAFEDLALEETRDLYETNVFGVMRVTQSILSIMRQQQSALL